MTIAGKQLDGQISLFEFPEIIPKFDYQEYMDDHPEELKKLNDWYLREYGGETHDTAAQISRKK